MTPNAFHALFGRRERAKMPFPVHPHMLRHGCGYALANAGHDTRALQAWLGHKNIQHTVRYTELTASLQGLLALTLPAMRACMTPGVGALATGAISLSRAAVSRTAAGSTADQKSVSH